LVSIVLCHLPLWLCSADFPHDRLQNWCRRSVTFCYGSVYGSGSSDPYSD
jgi:hypothetical protein